MSRTRTPAVKRGARAGGRRGPSRLFGSLWKRGATEAALLVTAAAVASGVVFGAGVARATSQTSDGQTWVSASDGTIVQINPVTGQPVSRIEIPLAGQVTVQQGNGVVLVTSAGTGKAVSIDVGQVTASRSRDVDPSTRKALLAPGGRTLIAELDTGVIRVVDSATMIDTGEAFVGPGPFVDVVVDKTAEVWALGTDGTLTSVHWSDDARRFIKDDSRSLEGVDASSRMVPHPRGVTVLSPSRKALVQVGTGADVQTIVDGMDGEIQPAENSPRDLVAATLQGRKAVMILDGDRVWKADLSAAGCDDPGRPAVFGDRIYVPCAGQGRTLVLDRTGQPARDAIVTGENDTPQIVGDDDSLVVTSGSAGTTVTVDAQGRQHRSEIRSPSIPVVKPKRVDPSKAGGSASASQTPPVEPTPTSAPDPTSTPEPPTSEQPPPDQPDPQTPVIEPSSGPVLPTPVQPSTPASNGPGATAQTNGGTALDGPRNVRAEAIGPGVATVSWSAPERRPDRYLVRTTDGAGGTQISGGAESASITVSARGSAQFVVVADFGADGLVQSQPSNVVNWTAQTTTNSSTTPTTPTTPTTRTTPTRPGPGPDCRGPRLNGAVPNVLASCPSTSSGSSTRPTTPTSPTSGQPSSQTPTDPTTPTTPTTPPSTPTTPTTPPSTPTTPPPVTTPTTPPPVTTPTTPPPVEPSTPPPPVAPPAPANFNAYLQDPGSSNAVQADWTAVDGVTYTVSFSKNNATPTVQSPAASGATQFYGPRMTGSVVVSIYASQNGLNSETLTLPVDLMPVDQCNPLRAGSSWLHGLPMQNCCPVQQPGQPVCQIPLRGDTSWLQPDTVSAVPSSGSGGRIALAVTLLMLAGGIHLARVRSRRTDRATPSVAPGARG